MLNLNSFLKSVYRDKTVKKDIKTIFQVCYLFLCDIIFHTLKKC